MSEPGGVGFSQYGTLPGLARDKFPSALARARGHRLPICRWQCSRSSRPRGRACACCRRGLIALMPGGAARFVMRHLTQSMIAGWMLHGGLSIGGCLCGQAS